MLLIDEVDRVEVETEALLLEILSEYQVSIPELGTVQATQIPMVFLTSNNTRELSEALKRRCLYLHVDYPSMEREKEIVAGVIYQPISDELFWTEKGNGAFLNDKRLRVSGRRDIKEAVFATGIPFAKVQRKAEFSATLARLMPQVAGVRRFGSARAGSGAGAAACSTGAAFGCSSIGASAERDTINYHIVATNKMLEKLPWPKHLQNVPEFAGGHHERMDGKGYPRGLTREQMSVQARCMGIADIFEALTAKDRPYKKGKTLTESLTILGKFKLNGHIDPDLFDLFLRSGVYLRYAERYLKPEQIDTVDIEKYLH